MALTSYNRWQAFAVHFAISLGIFLVLLAVVFGYWYPGVLREADQSWQRVLMLIVGVDLVLGPLLTLIVFNPVKKSLKMDLSIIAIAQISALLAGMYTVHQSRPIALYVAYPPEGMLLLTADRINPQTHRHIEQSGETLFYFSPMADQSPFGVEQPEQLQPDNLTSLTDPGFRDHMERMAGNFVLSDGFFLPLADNDDMAIILNTNGSLKQIVTAHEDDQPRE
jgi:hypothetical protein